MLCYKLFSTIILILGVVSCKNFDRRNPRFIRGTHTVTKTEISTVTSLVPSSCVQVDATLPPCRGIRFLNFPQFTRNQSTINPEPEETLEGKVETTPLGWGEYLGIYAPTVTVTDTKIVKTVVSDPRIVVTYAVKGCSPFQLPLDLDRCPESTQAVPVNRELPTSTVLPTATLPVSTPRNTKVIDVTNATSFTVRQVNEAPISNNLEGSNEINENIETDRQARATEPLPF